MNRSVQQSWLLALSLVLALAPVAVRACPFCSAVSMTLGEELKSSDAVVLATLINRPASSDPAGGAPVKSKFKIVKVLKGDKLLKGKQQIELLYFGTQEPGATFLLFGVDPKELAWGTPTALSQQGVKYLEKVAQLGDAPAERLVFFQEYFEDADPLLSSDAFNEFAKAPFADVVLLKDSMHRDKLIAWIKDDKVPASRRRLYLTMLGMCGTTADVPMIEAMIKSEDRQARTALDAMIGCYLNLKGADGLPLVEDLFLKNDKSEYVDTYSAIVALRVLGQETNLIPKQRLVAALRHMLDRPQLADLVIPDLARWQDWGSMPKLVALFKDANEESSWVRVPVVQFLRACPDPKALEYIAELTKIDPDAVKRATNYLALPGAGGGAAAAQTAQPAGGAASDKKAPAKDAKPAAAPDASSQSTPDPLFDLQAPAIVASSTPHLAGQATTGRLTYKSKMLELQLSPNVTDTSAAPANGKVEANDRELVVPDSYITKISPRMTYTFDDADQTPLTPENAEQTVALASPAVSDFSTVAFTVGPKSMASEARDNDLAGAGKSTCVRGTAH
jgi:hypothetical protein